ncbi:plasmid maintenance protein [Borrelia coriaceae]|uniref:plasmid maintenance protein n=1 Tax=Borrelia coriaceae TaxID=144 RepID=UPI00048464C3|nr:plasmid maintenance protein [Borrelia coriaceae]
MENKQPKELNTRCHNKYQHKLITLISTIEYINNKHKKYTQSNLLYYFNGNLKRNGHKETTLKTLQKYLYKLEKEFQVTINYHRHLGVNMGTEVHYKLRYSKKNCHHIINKHFKDKQKERFQKRVNANVKKTCDKKETVEKEECFNNIYNKKEENRTKTRSIEKLQIKKYAKKSKVKNNLLSSILNLNLNKKIAIEIFKAVKRDENQSKKKAHNTKNSTKTNLQKILKDVKTQLVNAGYSEEQLTKKINVIYDKYQHKPHFIIQNNKYNDLNQIIENLKKSVEYVKSTIKEDKEDIRNNIFSILFDQLRYKVSHEILVPILKDYLNKQNKLGYAKVFSNYYYYELMEIIGNNKANLQLGKFEKITS